MSDAIASPAPLGPVTEESTPAPSVGAGPGPSVGRSYDDVSYTHYPSHGSGFSTDPAYAYNYQPPHHPQWHPTPAAMPFSPQQPYQPYHPATPYNPAPPSFYGQPPPGPDQQPYVHMACAPAAPPPYWTAPAHSAAAATPGREDLLLERLSRLEALLDRQRRRGRPSPADRSTFHSFLVSIAP